jgi:hypothetical protein
MMVMAHAISLGQHEESAAAWQQGQSPLARLYNILAAAVLTGF